MFSGFRLLTGGGGCKLEPQTKCETKKVRAELPRAMTVIAKEILCVAILCGSGLLGAGCHKKAGNDAAAATNQPQAEVPAAGAPSGTGGGRVPVAAPVPVKNASELDRALSNWVARNRRAPRNFEEFAATAGVNIPPPPNGKRYAIDKTGHVVLIKR
jgi:hypothetical protein